MQVSIISIYLHHVSNIYRVGEVAPYKSNLEYVKLEET
jgi:hypothetical protein